MRNVGLWVLALFFSVSFAQQEPTPYELIRNPIPDTLDPKFRDSLNLKMSRVRVNQAGYLESDGNKYFYYIGTGSSFSVIYDDTKAPVTGATGVLTSKGGSTSSSLDIYCSNSATKKPNGIGDWRYTMSGTGPSGALQEGKLPSNLPTDTKLRVVVGSDTSATFVVSERTYTMVKDALLKFYGIQRSGNSQSWFHGPSHVKDPFVGGWYDCGDHLKESMTQSFAFVTLALQAAMFPDRDGDSYGFNHANTINTDGIPDLLREARHGADFFLSTYDAASGDVSKMVTSVATYTTDHNWWGRPEYADQIPPDRGGPPRVTRVEVGGNITGRVAAGLALTARLYEDFDPAYSAKALAAAKVIYTYGRAHHAGSGSDGAYTNEVQTADDLGLAALALWWATGETTYKDDLFTTKLGTFTAEPEASRPNGGFQGGWMAYDNGSPRHGKANSSYASMQVPLLHAIYRLILANPATAQSFGYSESQRLELWKDVAYGIVANIGELTGGSATINLPPHSFGWIGSNLSYDPTWFSMWTIDTWIYNRYQAGNITELAAYWDVTKDLGNFTAGVDWKSSQVKEVMIRQLDYMLGVNPWDLSMVYGIGDKNYNHPHHRAANPEGRNTAGGWYKYTVPHGALQGGLVPGGTNAYKDEWFEYHVSETCIDGTTQILMPVMNLAKSEDFSQAPAVQVQIDYVGYDKAIITVRQDRYGTAKLHLGKSATTLTQDVNDSVPGVIHKFEVTGLSPGTVYYMTAEAQNGRSGLTTVKYQIDSTQTPYSFTTQNSPPAAASIQNVKVCNVSADSAEIMWYTPNGEYESAIYWDEKPLEYDKMAGKHFGDINGVPTKFHRVKIGGLKEKTRYYFIVESDGERKAVDEDGARLEFTTPVTQVDFEVRTLSYTNGSLPALGINVVNQDDASYDSLELRVYMRGTETEIASFGAAVDIGIQYKAAGEQGVHFKNEIDPLVQKSKPVKLEDTYDAATGTYMFYLALPMGSVMMQNGSRFRLDVLFRKRNLPWNDDLLYEAPARPFGSTTKDWSWMPHSRANGEPADYVGMPQMTKEAVDDAIEQTPINPYVTVYRKNQFVWGFSPSYSEMTTKKANYQISIDYDAPFNVPNGSFVKLDAASSRYYVKGTAKITEGGAVNSIWVNGVEVPLSEDVAKYDVTTDSWNLNIPVKFTLGANKVDLTVFAGPPTSCESCQKNGGCAFDNRSYYFEFSNGKFTPSSLIITDKNTGGAVVTPAVPGQTQFQIQVIDKDKSDAKVPDLEVLVINPRKEDTLKVSLKLSGDKYILASAISAVAKDPSSTSASGSEIAFFGGDTIVVRYTDPEDNEDISEQKFWAAPSFPSLVSAIARDTDCNGVMDMLDLLFSQAFDKGDRMDTLWVSVRDPLTQASDSFQVVNIASVDGKSSFSVTLPERGTIPRTGSPVGKVSAYMVPIETGIREVTTKSITDGISPQLVGVSLLENPAPRSAQDTLKISFNEAVVLDNKNTWPLSVFNGSVAVATTGITVVGEATTEDNGRSWLYVIEGNTNGQIIDSGFTSQVQASFEITDLYGNSLDPAGPCATPVPIVEVPKPVPVDLAEMRDQDGDGSADQLYLEFARKLRTKDMLDSFVVKWGSPVQLKSFAPELPRQWTLGMKFGSHMEGKYDENGDPMLDADSTPILVEVADTMSTLTINFKDSTFAYGTTHGYLSGKGGVIPRLGPEGGFFDREYIVNDAVGPVIVTARKGKNLGNLDSLAIVISEPVDTLDADFMIERRRGAEVVGVIPMRVIRASDSLYVFLYTSDAIGAVRIGDYVRLVSTKPGVVDKSGNEPGVNNPWVEVKGSLENTVSYDITMQVPVSGGKTRKDIAKGYPVDPPKESEYIRVTIVDPRTGNEVKLGGGSGSIVTQPTSIYDTTEYKHLGPTFLVNVQLPGALIQQGGKDAWNYLIKMQLNIFDNLGQFVNHLQMQVDLDKFGRGYLNPDGSLSLRLEWMVHDKAAPKSQTGRLVSTGAYVGVFQFNSTATALVDDEAKYNDKGVITAPPSFRKGQVVKSSQTKRKTFGVMRAQ